MSDFPRQDELGETPAGLGAELKAMFGSAPVVREDIDNAVLSTARRRLAHRRRVRLAWQTVTSTAAAAALAMLVWLGPWQWNSAPAPSPHSAMAMAHDFNRDGDLDIVDAFVLARHIRDGETPLAEWDVNHDGAVNSDDADAIAMAAVSLSPREVIQ